MRKYILNLILGLLSTLLGVSVSAQCPTISCPSNITVDNDAGNCSAVVNYTAPVGINPCPDTTVTFNYTGTIDTWTVPAGVTFVTIEVRGAEGGTDGSSTVAAGLGAIMIGGFTVTPGSTLRILAGEMPARNGGGGGSFVTDITNNPLIIAGGGGGSGAANDSPNKHANITTTGGTGSGGGGNGGTAGNGGVIGASFASGAGGGLLTDGQDGWTANTGGNAFVNGGAATTAGWGLGGFGGGGNGSGNAVGGGGGGYSGGGAASNSLGSGGVGGGGASYNSGTNQNNTAGIHNGNGQVLISWSLTPVTTIQTAGLASGATFPVGVTTNTFEVTAGAQTNTCSFTVTVNDTTAPTITCPGNVTSCVPVVNGIAATTSDNCSGETVAYSFSGATTGTGSGDASGTSFNQGVTTVKYIATDASGNKDSCTFNVTVLAPLTGTVNNTICNNGSVTVNGTVYNAGNPTGTEIFTNIGPNNCDSTVTVSLNVLPALTGSVNNTICNNDSVVVNGTVYNAGNPTGTEIFTNIGPNNCDSTVTVSLNVLPTLTGTVNNTICNNDSVTVNGTVYNAGNPTGTEIFTNIGPNNCDSTVTVSLNVLPALTGTVNNTICNNDSVVVNGTVYNAGNPTGTEIFTNVGPNNCDSTVTVNLNVLAAIDITVNNTSPTLTSNENGASYQWLDCDNNFAVIPTATSQSYTATANGNYAVEVTVGSCVDTSACENVSGVGINENSFGSNFKIYPNPTKDVINIDLGNTNENMQISILSVDGKLVYQLNNITERIVSVNMDSFGKGIYILKVSDATQQSIHRITKK